jgi:hypothetical protein
LSKNIAVVEEARIPILSSCGPLVTPPRSRVTANAVMLPFWPGVSGVVLAKTVKKSAKPPFEIQSFSPFRIQCLPSGDRSARVLMLKASLPEPGSVRQNAAISSPDASRGR